MQAYQITSFGAADVLEQVTLEQPTLAPGQLLIQVKALSLNPIDIKTRIGQGIVQADQLPLILGWDVSGVVAEVADGVTDFAVGDEVFGMLAFPLLANAYAEYVVANPSDIVKKPAGINHETAAAATLAALTAWQALFEVGSVTSGQRVLIHAGAGGVGHMAIQFAKLKGATVYTTASAPSHESLKALGADHCIDYRNEQFEDVVSDLDFVFDTVGGETLQRSFKALKKGGELVSILGRKDPEVLAQARAQGIDAKDMIVHTDKAQLQEIANLLEQQQFTPIIDKVYDFSEMHEAHSYLEAGRAKGKVIVRVGD